MHIQPIPTGAGRDDGHLAGIHEELAAVPAQVQAGPRSTASTRTGLAGPGR